MNSSYQSKDDTQSYRQHWITEPQATWQRNKSCRGFMKIRLIATIILSGALAFSTQATPINFSHIGDPQSGRQTKGNASSQATTNSSDAVNASLTVESLEQPEFVRLSDGRLIPYGPGVICSEACVESEAIANPSGFPRKWLIALPLAGAALVGVILATSDSSRTPRTAVDNNTKPPTDTVTPTPTPTPPGGGDQPQPVPEPATLALMGAGLAIFSRRRVLEFIQRQKK